MADHTAINTLEYVEDLEPAGVDSDQARAMAKALDKALVTHLATREDLTETRAEITATQAETKSELKTDIAELRADMADPFTRFTYSHIGATAALLAIAVAILKLT